MADDGSGGGAGRAGGDARSAPHAGSTPAAADEDVVMGADAASDAGSGGVEEAKGAGGAGVEEPDVAQNHPRWWVQQKDLLRTRALPFVVSCKPLTESPEGEALGKGWLWSVVIAGPPGTGYEGGRYRLRVAVPASYPRGNPPTVQFHCIMVHPQVDDLGFPLSFFYDAVPAPRGLADVVYTAFTMLGSLLATEPEPDDEDIAMQWATHPPTCTCPRFPMPFADFQALSGEQQREHIEALKRRYMEVERPQRFQQYQMYMMSRTLAQQRYKPQHPALFDAEAGWRPEWFAPSFLAAVKAGTAGALRGVLTEEVPGIYSFDMFTPAFCDMLQEELNAFNKNTAFHKNRPNSMNRYGIILNDMGLERMNDVLLRDYVAPLARLLYPDVGGASLDHHHVFSVEYAPGEDLNLDMHVDDSEVTVNVNLVDGFTGAGLAFCGRYVDPTHRKHTCTYKHIKGRAVIHSGKHRHGALNITSGRRSNLIVWCRSTSFRRSKASQIQRGDHHGETPDAVCLSRTHDPDYDTWAATFGGKAGVGGSTQAAGRGSAGAGAAIGAREGAGAGGAAASGSGAGGDAGMAGVANASDDD